MDQGGWDLRWIEAACAQRAGIDPAILGHAARRFLRIRLPSPSGQP